MQGDAAPDVPVAQRHLQDVADGGGEFRSGDLPVNAHAATFTAARVHSGGCGGQGEPPGGFVGDPGRRRAVIMRYGGRGARGDGQAGSGQQSRGGKAEAAPRDTVPDGRRRGAPGITVAATTPATASSPAPADAG